MSKYFDLRNDIDHEKIEEAANIIKNGGLVLFPTETVYGIGADGLNPEAVQKIYSLKGRKQDKPLILLISNKEMLNEIVEDINEVESKLIEQFWPGLLTIVFKKKACVPDIVTGGKDTVGVGLSSGEIARQLIQASNCPIAAPSANFAGEPNGTAVEKMSDALKNKVDCIIDGGESENDLASTVVRVIDGVPKILREGKITLEEINKSLTE